MKAEGAGLEVRATWQAMGTSSRRSRGKLGDRGEGGGCTSVGSPSVGKASHTGDDAELSSTMARRSTSSSSHAVTGCWRGGVKSPAGSAAGEDRESVAICRPGGRRKSCGSGRWSGDTCGGGEDSSKIDSNSRIDRSKIDGRSNIDGSSKIDSSKIDSNNAVTSVGRNEDDRENGVGRDQWVPARLCSSAGTWSMAPRGWLWPLLLSRWVDHSTAP